MPQRNSGPGGHEAYTQELLQAGRRRRRAKPAELTHDQGSDELPGQQQDEKRLGSEARDQGGCADNHHGAEDAGEVKVKGKLLPLFERRGAACDQQDDGRRDERIEEKREVGGQWRAQDLGNTAVGAKVNGGNNPQYYRNQTKEHSPETFL